MSDRPAIPYQQALSDLQAQLAKAIADCERFEIPPHMVRNCPSDLQRRDQAWRRRQSLEYQIAQLRKKHSDPVDKCLSLDK